MIDMLFGRAFSYWAKVKRILDEHAIDTPEELEQALDPWPKKIPVYDSRNNSRLLGHVHEVSRNNIRPSQNLRMAITGPLTVVPWEKDVSFDRGFKTVDFTIDKQTKDGWVYTPILLTSTPLEDLMKLRQFTLPGETRRQADERRYHFNRP